MDTKARTPKTRFALSPEERTARMSAAHEEMQAAVEAIASSADWKAFLDFSSKLHAYSAGNRFWLMQQAEQRGWSELGHVAGFGTWLKLGRHVRRGEVGLKILAPLCVKIVDPAGDGQATKSIVRGFKVESVFAACQTDGEGEIPEPAKCQLLTGDAQGWDALAALVEARGYTLSRAPLSHENGFTSRTEHTVVVADRLEPAAAVKTLAHELAHVMLHEHVDYTSNRGRCEVEAESVAYLVCSELGLPTDAYSFGYVAGWSSGDVKVVTAAADAAIKCAAEIVAAIESASEQIAA